MKDLRGSRHPYYCHHGNYYHNGAEERYESWADFKSEYGDIDVDMNLVWRWDWEVGMPLVLFMVHQRKARHGSISISVCKDDEESIKEYLRQHWQKLQDLWAEFST